jgi:GNAT superfamily N-acetyltransferase
VPAEDLWWQPAVGLNHIGFLFWHVVRDEDVVISQVTGGAELWSRGRWHERLGLDPAAQGTGFDPATLPTLSYRLEMFLEYAEEVWARTGPLLQQLSPGDLERPAWPGSGWDVARQLVEGCCCHSWLHLGEIRTLRGLRGWRFRE